MARRPPLTRDRIVAAGVQVADAGGLSAVSMRNVGKQLGVEAMSLYRYLAGKDELLDALADWVFTQIDPPVAGRPWRVELVKRSTQARRVLSGHPWSLTLIESRKNPGPTTLRAHDAVLGCLRADGFSIELAAHAFSAIDAYVFGFVLSEVSRPFELSAPAPDNVEGFVAHLDIATDEYPHLMEMVSELIVGRGWAFANEFDYGLDLVLDALERRREAELM